MKLELTMDPSGIPVVIIDGKVMPRPDGYTLNHHNMGEKPVLVLAYCSFDELEISIPEVDVLKTQDQL